MHIAFNRVPGQSPLGVYQNLAYPDDCDGIRYVSVHCGPWRLEFVWRWPTAAR